MSSRAFIYKVTHLDSGRVYIGQTRNKKGPLDRWSGHLSATKRGSKTHFHCAIRLYGVEAFKFEVIEECEEETANDRERYYIALHNSNKKHCGFNMSEGGDGGQNCVSEEVRQRISAANRGVPRGPCSPEKAKNISKAKLASGYRHSEETIKRIKDNRNITKLTQEWKDNISAGLLRSAVYKLTVEQVAEIQSLLHLSDATLASKFSVSRKTIWRIRNGYEKRTSVSITNRRYVFRQFSWV